MVTPADRTSIRLVTEGSPDDLARVATAVGKGNMTIVFIHQHVQCEASRKRAS